MLTDKHIDENKLTVYLDTARQFMLDNIWAWCSSQCVGLRHQQHGFIPHHKLSGFYLVDLPCKAMSNCQAVFQPSKTST